MRQRLWQLHGFVLRWNLPECDGSQWLQMQRPYLGCVRKVPKPPESCFCSHCLLCCLQIFSLQSDWDCSLAGICMRSGECACDPWTSGVDCSYLNFEAVDRQASVGYLDPKWSSWGGNAVLGSDGQWHLFMAEIGPEGRQGLGGWGSHSQVFSVTCMYANVCIVGSHLSMPGI